MFIDSFDAWKYCHGCGEALVEGQYHTFNRATGKAVRCKMCPKYPGSYSLLFHDYVFETEDGGWTLNPR